MLDAQIERPARLQMIVALILGLVLVAIPLYLWRRPRAESIAVAAGGSDGGALAVSGNGVKGSEQIVIGDPKNVSCHDPGPKKTAPDQCDHVVDFEKAFAKAIEENASCVPSDAGGGTIIYLAEVSFRKKSVGLQTPSHGRTLKSPKVAGTCERAVSSKLKSVPLGGMKHDHVAYRVSITATYPGAVKR